MRPRMPGIDDKYANNEAQPTSDPVNRNSIDRVVNPAGEEEFVSSDEDGAGNEAD